MEFSAVATRLLQRFARRASSGRRTTTTTTSAMKIVVALAMLCSVGMADDAPIPDLEIIRSSYIQAVSAIRSMDCRLTHTQLAEPPQDPEAVVGIWLYEIQYARDENRQMLSTFGKDPKGKGTIRIWASFDGKVYSSWAESLMETAEEGYFSPWGRIEADSASELTSIQTVDDFLGYRLAQGQMDLTRLILKPETRVVDWDLVEGHRCLRLELPTHVRNSKRPESLWKTEVWLDPEFDYLPRRIHLESTQKSKFALELLVEEFGQYPNGDGAKPLLLPKRAVWKGGRFTRRMVLESAIVNQPLAADLFRPSFPLGTFVKESIPGLPVKTYAVGGDEIRKQLSAKATQKAVPRKIVAVVQEPPDASPAAPGTSGWFRFLRYGAWTCLIAVGGVIAWRAYRRA